MKKVIGIIDKIGIDYDEKSIEIGLGGSETWTVQISHEFQKWGYHVIVFNGTNQYWHFDNFGVEWVPYQLLQSRLDYQKFDYIIITRFYEGLINLIEDKNCCDKIFIQCHDIGCGEWYPSLNRYHKYEEDSELSSPLIKKFIALSEFHIESLIQLKNIPRNKIAIIPNGIDLDLFKDIDGLSEPRDHTILWSSRPERGVYLLTDTLLPLIRKRVPDVKINISSYDEIPYDLRVREYDGIYYLGKLSKSQLYKEMQKHRVWFYPAIFPETFNITSLETVMCGNIPVMPFVHGMATTFSPFKGFFMNEKFKETVLTGIGDDTLAIPEAVDMICEILLNGESNIYKKLRISLIDYIRMNYTWTNVVEKYIKLFKEI